jgi:hypothetical protein
VQLSELQERGATYLTMQQRQFVLVCLLIVSSIVLTRTVVAEFTHWAVFTGGFDNAFFIVWTNTAVIVIVIPCFSLCWHLWLYCKSDSGPLHSPIPESVDEAVRAARPAPVSRALRLLCFNFPFEQYPKPTFRQLCRVVVPMSALWVGSSYVYYNCFTMTAPGECTTLETLGNEDVVTCAA